MQLNKSDIERSLKRKGFIERQSDHKVFLYKTMDGVETSIMTHMSHGSRKSVEDHLINAMAKQCRLKKSEFVDLVKCPIDREKYEAFLKERALL